jgi:hypothetical protein
MDCGAALVLALGQEARFTYVGYPKPDT